MLKLKVTSVGSSTGVVFPKEALARLRVVKGDYVFLTESVDGFHYPVCSSV
jgi:antitoxin component of MazEF toxin-antitoxin module